MATVTETSAPRRVESSLLVVEHFKDAGGFEWKPGDRASLARRDVREAARNHPELFMVEYETAPLDPQAEWFLAVVETYEARYAEAKRLRDGAEERHRKELREELKQQEKSQPDLERRWTEQEREREERAEKTREAFERERIERELEVGLGPPGFHS